MWPFTILLLGAGGLLTTPLLSLVEKRLSIDEKWLSLVEKWLSLVDM